jgi:hypothetical protein
LTNLKNYDIIKIKIYKRDKGGNDMAKISFTKLKCKVETSITHIEWEGETIEVKQYLPIQEKLALIGRVIMQAHEQDQNYSNPVKVDVFRELEIVFAYTNISFTDKQKEDLPKLYDMICCSGLLKAIKDAIPHDEISDIVFGIKDSIEAVYKYQNSVLGVLDTIKTDYKNMDLDINKLREGITDPELLDLVNGIITNLN